MNNSKNKSLKIQTLCLVTTFAFFVGECFCREVFAGAGGEAELLKKYDLGYKEDKNIIKNAKKRIYNIENAITGDPFQRSEYIRAHRSEINKNKNLIELAENLTDSKKRYNELVDKSSKPNINGTEKQRLLDNLSEVVNEIAKRENCLKQKVQSYKPDSPKVSNFDKFSAWLNQFFTKKSIGAGDRYLLKKMKEEKLLNNNTNETEQPLKNPSEENPKSDDSNIKSNIKWFKETFSYYYNGAKNYFSTNKNTDNNGDKQLENSSKKDDSKLGGDKTRQSENLLKNNNQTSSNITNGKSDLAKVLNAKNSYWLDPKNTPNVNASKTEQSKNSFKKDDSESDGNKNNQQSKGSSTNNDSKSGNGEDKQSEKGSESDGNKNNQQSKGSSTNNDSESGNGEDKQSEKGSESDGNKNNQQSKGSSTNNDSGSGNGGDKQLEGSSTEDEMIDRYYDGSQKAKINSSELSFTPIPTQTDYDILFLKDSESSNGGDNQQSEDGSKSDGNRDNQSDGSSKENNSESDNGKGEQTGEGPKSDGNRDNQSDGSSKENDSGSYVNEDSSRGYNSESGDGEDKQSGGSSTKDNSGSDANKSLYIENSNTSTEEKASLKLPKKDIISKVFTPEEILSDVVSMISTPTTNIISERLSSDNSVIAAGSNSNLVASVDNNSINLGDSNDSYEVWSKMHYNYSSNSNRSIHIFGLTLGGECGFKNNKYKIGLAYTFNSGNGSKYISNSISIYSSINDINIRNFRNNFANVILTYGRLNTNIVKNENKLVAIKHGYSTDLISLNTIFGHNIVLPNSNGIVIPTIGIRYDYINRNTYTNNALKHGELSMNIIAPTVGVSYTNKVLNDNLTIKVGVNLGYGFNLNKKTNIILKTTNNSHSETIGYTSTNTLIGNFNFGLAYKVKKNIELSFDSNISYGINETFNAGFNFGGRYQF